ncbi:hypothetical protein B0T10DRAFT_48344 [Thelonectria olida]|uniref:Uncharacterized protein n=1 Tax=Thelonectria olida TaxID=1576542 RepID=A0A9P9APP6_9HYPO|nr:hypothetical protein B0T10DRAFT_48344 [Thelonectria olida]
MRSRTSLPLGISGAEHMWKTLLIPVSPADMTMNRHPSSYHPRNCLPLNMLSEKTAQTSKMAPAIHDDEHQRLLTDVTHDDEHERLSRLLPGRRREMITIVPLLLVWPCAHITLRIGGVWLSCVSGILNCLWLIGFLYFWVICVHSGGQQLFIEGEYPGVEPWFQLFLGTDHQYHLYRH